VRDRIGADDGGDFGEGVSRPEVDRDEQGTGHDERGRLEDAGVVVAGVAVEHRQVDEGVIGRIGWSILGIGVSDVEAAIRG